jgi:hypothetical protein
MTTAIDIEIANIDIEIAKIKKDIALWTQMLASRTEPKEKAGSFEIGFIAKGVDNCEYIVVANKKGIKRWKEKSTHDAKKRKIC